MWTQQGSKAFLRSLQFSSLMVSLRLQWVAQYEPHSPPSPEWELDRDSAHIVSTYMVIILGTGWSIAISDARDIWVMSKI